MRDGLEVAWKTFIQVGPAKSTSQTSKIFYSLHRRGLHHKDSALFLLTRTRGGNPDRCRKLVAYKEGDQNNNEEIYHRFSRGVCNLSFEGGIRKRSGGEKKEEKTGVGRVGI